MKKSLPINRSLPSFGFTLVELLTVVTLAGILAAISVPSFREMIGAQRIRSGAYDLTAAILFARSEAIKRNASVNMVQTGGNWKNGWTIVSGTDTLRTQSAFSGLAISDSATLATLSFGNDGRTTTAATNFTIDLTTSLPTVPARCIKISPTGVPNSKQGSCT